MHSVISIVLWGLKEKVTASSMYTGPLTTQGNENSAHRNNATYMGGYKPVLNFVGQKKKSFKTLR